MTKFNVGSISHGTLRSQDLLKSFADELERLDEDDKKYPALVKTARGLLDMTDENGDLTDLAEDAAPEVIDELHEALNWFAPEGYYFGAHDGDGSDYGFWVYEDPAA